MKNEYLRKLPKVDELFDELREMEFLNEFGKVILTDAIRQVIEDSRNAILQGKEEAPDKEVIKNKVFAKAKKMISMNLRPVINATGTVLHTNLGRARLSKKAAEAVLNVSMNYSNLEYNIEAGMRGERYDSVTGLITGLTGTESALVVNNNASAVLLVLSALAKGKNVIVSRGEQVEIGGMFRVPEIMEQSGSTLVEVGTTNKTHLSDYEKNIDENSVLLKVHTSNFKIIGFTQEVEVSQLSKLGEKYQIPVLYDLGSGALIDFEKYGIWGEPSVKDAVSSGADVICFSGDKLLGGPQAGIIIGKKKYIDIMKKHPLTRALRIDKMTLAALEATLREYIDESEAVKNIPILRQIFEEKENIKSKAEELFNILNSSKIAANVRIIEDKATIGGGSMPGYETLTYCAAISQGKISLNEIEIKLRELDLPIIARISKDALLIDMLTVEKENIEYIGKSLIDILGVETDE